MRKVRCECYKIESQMLDHEAGTKVAGYGDNRKLSCQG
jgi:hypothetical protein